MQKIKLSTATFLVIANMVGTGVFTSLGFQLVEIQNIFSILLLWFIGAIIALSGAFSYAELGVTFKENGGEYNFLSKIYHPLIGYLSGFVSLTVGFAAPVALAAMTFAIYSKNIFAIPPTIISILLILLISILHSKNLKLSSSLQNVSTVIKIAVLITFVIIGVIHTESNNAIYSTPSLSSEITKPAFAISLIFVTYTYTGWNAASYIVNEIKNPTKNLPKALLLGTIVVSILYLLIQWVILKNATINQLSGKIEVAQIALVNILGNKSGLLFSGFIALVLVSSISAMVWIGPRVTQSMAKDYKIWKFLSKTNSHNIPVSSIWFQSLISVVMILSGSFEQILIYTGITLQISAALSVAGVIIIRRKKMDVSSYRSPFFPLPQLIFLAVTIWILSYFLYFKFNESIIGLIIFLLGYLTFYINKKINLKYEKV